MKKIIVILITVLIGCSGDCFGQGMVTRPSKQQTQSHKQQTKSGKRQTGSHKRQSDSDKRQSVSGKHKDSTPKVTVSEPDGYFNGHSYVDLGLPSGNKWATYNIGATNPFEKGEYFAWGEISTKSDYTEENSLTMNVSINDYSGNPTNDVASYNWGNSWVTPNQKDVRELIEYCRIELINEDKLKGVKIIGPNDKSIFIIAAGHRSKSNHYNSDFVEYWLSTPLDSDKYSGGNILYYDLKEGLQNNRWYGRWYGLPIRPVFKTTI